MRKDEVKLNMHVSVSSLGVLKQNLSGVAQAQPMQSIYIFKPALFDNRQNRLNETGIAARYAAGLAGIVWVVRHDSDGSEAVYHFDKLSPFGTAGQADVSKQKARFGATGESVIASPPDLNTAASTAASEALDKVLEVSAADVAPVALSPDAMLKPTGRFVFDIATPDGETGQLVKTSELAIEVYVDADATALEADMLVVALPSSEDSLPARKNVALHEAIRARAGSFYHAQLVARGQLKPLATLLCEAMPTGQGPSFKRVVFINGTSPTADALHKALQTACEHEAASVIISPGDFLVTTSQLDAQGQVITSRPSDADIGEIMGYFVDLILALADEKPVLIRTLKLVF